MKTKCYIFKFKPLNLDANVISPLETRRSINAAQADACLVEGKKKNLNLLSGRLKLIRFYSHIINSGNTFRSMEDEGYQLGVRVCERVCGRACVRSQNNGPSN